MKRVQTIFISALLFLPIGLEGCALFKATGRTVEATGRGAGHAVAETGRGAGDAVSGTGRAISRIPEDLDDDARRY